MIQHEKAVGCTGCRRQKRRQRTEGRWRKRRRFETRRFSADRVDSRATGRRAFAASGQRDGLSHRWVARREGRCWRLRAWSRRMTSGGGIKWVARREGRCWRLRAWARRTTSGGGKKKRRLSKKCLRYYSHSYIHTCIHTHIHTFYCSRTDFQRTRSAVVEVLSLRFGSVVLQLSCSRRV